MVMENMQNKWVNKRGQVTIFIIIAIIIVGIVLVYFLFLKPKSVIDFGDKPDFEGCVNDVISTSLVKLGTQGGYASPGLYHTYQDERISYLCYTNLYYKRCSSQTPFLDSHFESELRKDAEQEIKNCYTNSLEELQKRGYSVVSQQEPEVSIDIGFNKINTKLKAPVVLTSEGNVGGQSFTEFNIEMASQMPQIIQIAGSILEEEIRIGESNINELMFYYPDIVIDAVGRDDGSIIYIIENIKTNDKFQFAIRNFVFPPGYGYYTGLVI